MAGLGLRFGDTTVRGVNAIDPRTLAGFQAGLIYIPGVGVTTVPPGGPGDPTTYRWQSQGTTQNAGTLLSTALSFEPPYPATASNGVQVWEKVGATGGGFIVDPVDACACPSDLVSVFGWFKSFDVLETYGNMFYWEMWPEGGLNRNRAFAYRNDPFLLTPNKMSVNASPLGVGGDVPPDREKGNYGEPGGPYPTPDTLEWNFIEWRWNFATGVNRLDPDGAVRSSKQTVDFGGIENYGDGFSAPPGMARLPPGGPVLGAGLYSGTTRLCVGGNGNGSGWRGQIGWFGICNGTLTAAERLGIMNFQRPE